MCRCQACVWVVTDKGLLTCWFSCLENYAAPKRQQVTRSCFPIAGWWPNEAASELLERALDPWSHLPASGTWEGRIALTDNWATSEYPDQNKAEQKQKQKLVIKHIQSGRSLTRSEALLGFKGRDWLQITVKWWLPARSSCSGVVLGREQYPLLSAAFCWIGSPAQGQSYGWIRLAILNGGFIPPSVSAWTHHICILTN